jgi:hypothetical protein
MPGFKISIAAIAVTIALASPEFAAPLVPQSPAAQSEDGPLSRLVQIAFANGAGGPLSGKICTALGVTKDNESFPVEQLSESAQGNSRSFNVSRHRGHLDVIVALKTKEATLVFLTSAKGDLAKVVLEKPGMPIREIPINDGMAAFEKEKAWWLGTWMPLHYPDPGRQ